MLEVLVFIIAALGAFAFVRLLQRLINMLFDR